MQRIVAGGVMGIALLVGSASGWAAPEQEQERAHPGHHHMGMMGDHDHQGNVDSQQQKNETIYVCPMHQEVRATEPGRCPKCGMNLEPQPAESTEEESGHEASDAHQHSDTSTGTESGGHHH